MPTFSRFIKNRDIFGHKVLLNFDNKGNTHATLCGGITSIALVLVILIIAMTKWANLPDDYSLFDFLSYVGGLMYFLYNFIDMIVKPIANYSFLMRALKRLYLVRTMKPENLQLEK